MNDLQRRADHLQHELAQLFHLIDSDHYASAFQTLGQYRNALRDFIARALVPVAGEPGMAMGTERLTWHPVRSCRPDSDMTVLVFDKSMSEPVWPGYLDGDVWRTAEGLAINPSHWCDLPGGPT
jgi:hypothetical protein